VAQLLEMKPVQKRRSGTKADVASVL
jgi:hypothetical protein